MCFERQFVQVFETLNSKMWQRHSALTQHSKSTKKQISMDVDLIILGILDIEPSRSWDLVLPFTLV